MVGKGESVENLKRIWLIFSFTSVEKVETFVSFPSQDSAALTLSPVMSAVLGLSHSGGVTR